jgi:hypothetical protein
LLEDRFWVFHNVENHALFFRLFSSSRILV